MLGLARRTAPDSQLILANFLEEALPDQTYHGIFAKAILHLFPKSEFGRFLARIKSILVPGGIVYLTTTLETIAAEGVSTKQDYAGSPPRYRARWTASELSGAILAHGLKILREGKDTEAERGKSWISYWVTKE
jgi:DNA-binding HxlR family transcriptional regulator